jgi:hypothetical protein
MVIPSHDMVIAHKTNPTALEKIEFQGKEGGISVKLDQFLKIVGSIVDAKID